MRASALIAAAMLTVTGPVFGASLTILPVGSTPWQSLDPALGVAGYNIIDFESRALPAGVTVAVVAPAGSYGPTSVLPFLFDPATDDPNPAKVFVPGVWDGSRVFVNRLDAAVPGGYVDSPLTKWGAFTFTFPAGTTSVGFSVGQIDLTQTISLNGVPFAGLTGSNFPTTGQRNGYLRFDASPGQFITSLSMTSNGGDGFAIDHLAYNVIPEPMTIASLAPAALLLARRRR